MSDTTVQVRASSAHNKQKQKLASQNSQAPSVGFTSNAKKVDEKCKAPTIDATTEAAKKGSSPMDNLPENVKPYLEKHGHAIVYGLVGLVAAILILTIGFWPVLLLAVLTAIGMIIGRYRDSGIQMGAATRSLASLLHK